MLSNEYSKWHLEIFSSGSKFADSDLSVSDALESSHEASIQEVFGKSIDPHIGADVETLQAIEDFGGWFSFEFCTTC